MFFLEETYEKEVGGAILVFSLNLVFATKVGSDLT